MLASIEELSQIVIQLLRFLEVNAWAAFLEQMILPFPIAMQSEAFPDLDTWEALLARISMMRLFQLVMRWLSFQPVKTQAALPDL